MALKPCRECGNSVSTEALTCPRCGVPNPIASESTKSETESEAGLGATGCFAVSIVVVVIGLIVGTIAYEGWFTDPKNDPSSPYFTGQTSVEQARQALKESSAEQASRVLKESQQVTPEVSDTGNTDSNDAAIGDNGIVSLVGSTGDVPVAPTTDDFDRMYQLFSAHDTRGLALMTLNGHLMDVPSGTKCLVIDIGLFKREIRILEGNYENRSGWVPREWVKKQ